MTLLKALFKRSARLLSCLLADRALTETATGTDVHIVVLRWDAKLGDSIVSSFFYREARKLNARITVLTVAELAELHAMDFAADQVIITSAAPGLGELFRLSRQLGKVDAVVHLVGRIQPAEIIFLRWLNPALIYSLDDNLRCVNRKFGADTNGLDMAARYQRVLIDLGAAEVQRQYIVPLPTRLPEPAMAPHILFNPYASRAEKCLSAERSVSLLRAIAEALPSRTIGILSSPASLQDAQRIQDAVARTNVRVVPGLSSPKDVAGYICRAQVVISVDTAVVHMAVGLSTRLVAIYPSMGDAFNCWLPPPSPLTHVIYSQQSPRRSGQSRIRNMNAFSTRELIDALHAMLTTPATLSIDARIVPGLGVASGTLARQLPLISQHYPQVATCHPGTINLALDQPLLLTDPDHRTVPLAWTPSGRTTEVFDFLHVELELSSSPARIPAWLYVAHGSPHRKTPWIHELIAHPLNLDNVSHCRLHLRANAVSLLTAAQPISNINRSASLSQ